MLRAFPSTKPGLRASRPWRSIGPPAPVREVNANPARASNNLKASACSVREQNSATRRGSSAGMKRLLLWRQNLAANFAVGVSLGVDVDVPFPVLKLAGLLRRKRGLPVDRIFDR